MVVVRETEENIKKSELWISIGPRLGSRRNAVDSSTQALLPGEVRGIRLVGRLTRREDFQSSLVAKRSIMRLVRTAYLCPGLIDGLLVRTMLKGVQLRGNRHDDT